MSNVMLNKEVTSCIPHLDRTIIRTRDYTIMILMKSNLINRAKKNEDLNLFNNF